MSVAARWIKQRTDFDAVPAHPARVQKQENRSSTARRDEVGIRSSACPPCSAAPGFEAPPPSGFGRLGQLLVLRDAEHFIERRQAFQGLDHAVLEQGMHPLLASQLTDHL